MPEYAKNQSAEFKNAIERVAIIGVRIAPNRTTCITPTNKRP